MFTRLALSILVLAWASVVLASPEPPVKAPAPGEIRLPVIDTPAPMPTNPTAVTRLTANQLYVIDSDVPLQVVASRDGFVAIAEEAGPLKIKGIFVDDPSGKPKTRTFKGPFLYTVEVIASGQVELVIFRDVKTPALRRTIDVDAGQGPQPPPPGPTPGPTPPKPDDVPPIPGPGLKVMIVYDPKVNLPEPQNTILYGKETRALLEAKCAVGPDGKTREYKFWPAGEAATGESKQWQDAYARASKGPLPFVIVSDGKSKTNSYEGPLPSTATEFQALLLKASK